MNGTTEAPVSVRQQIDIARIRAFFNDSFAVVRETDYAQIKEQVIELCDLVETSGFLKEVEDVRTQEAVADGEPLNPEEILPSAE